MHVRQRHDSRFHFGGKHIEAARNNHVLFAIGDIEEAIVVAITDISRVMPAKLPYLRSRLRKIVVARRDERAARDDFAGLIGRQ